MKVTLWTKQNFPFHFIFFQNFKWVFQENLDFNLLLSNCCGIFESYVVVTTVNKNHVVEISPTLLHPIVKYNKLVALCRNLKLKS